MRQIHREREAELRDLLYQQQATPEVRAILEYLAIRQDSVVQRMGKADAPEVFRHQGAMSELAGIIRSIKDGKPMKMGVTHGE